MHAAPLVLLRDGLSMLASSDGTGYGLCRSGKYQFYSCEQLAGQRTYWASHELELKLLMDKAGESTGGGVVAVIACQADYAVAREAVKVIDATGRRQELR
jgi:hypothetical protein